MDQFDPPPNPAKVTDSRASGYIAEHGRTSWELDALPPSALERIVEDAILEHVDLGTWDETKQAETDARDTLVAMRERFEDVRDFLRSDDE